MSVADLPNELEAKTLCTVDNPANLYIHGQLRKKIFKHVALNFHEAASKTKLGEQAPRVTLEGFSDKFLAAQRLGP